MKLLENHPYIDCDFGDKRLNKRAELIAEALPDFSRDVEREGGLAGMPRSR